MQKRIWKKEGSLLLASLSKGCKVENSDDSLFVMSLNRKRRKREYYKVQNSFVLDKK